MLRYLKMIKTKEELKQILGKSDLQDDEKETFIEFVSPFYDFYDFMLENHKKSFDEVDKEMSDYSLEIFPEYLEKMKNETDITSHLLSLSGDIMRRYAEKYGYKEPEKVGLALTKYTKIILMNE